MVHFYAMGPMSCLSCLSVTLAHCGQTVGWIKMPLGTEVVLGPGYIALDGTQLPPRKGAQQSPPFWPMSIVAKRSPISATTELFCLILWTVCLFVWLMCCTVVAKLLNQSSWFSMWVSVTTEDSNPVLCIKRGSRSHWKGDLPLEMGCST